jgi:hypothetical protein
MGAFSYFFGPKGVIAGYTWIRKSADKMGVLFGLGFFDLPGFFN